MEALFGTHVIKNDDSKVEVSEFSGDGKIVGLYFSAHWCPPCRAFTPKLGEYYTEQKKKSDDRFEMIFVSCDRDTESFKDYFATMPFLAIDFESEQKDALSQKFGISGIPALIFINGKDGSVITKDGRAHVTNNKDVVELLQ